VGNYRGHPTPLNPLACPRNSSQSMRPGIQT